MCDCVRVDGPERFRAIITRDSHEETTFAVVTARISFPRDEFLSRLETAITNWVTTARDGATALIASGYDFNIGDLSVHDCSYEVPLGEALAKQGILDLEIKVFIDENPSSRQWVFDRVLVKDREV